MLLPTITFKTKLLAALFIASQLVLPGALTVYRQYHSEQAFQEGLSAYNRGDYAQAKRSFRAAYTEQLKESALAYQQAETEHNLAWSTYRLRQDKQVVILFKKSAATCRALHAYDILAANLFHLGALYLDKGEIEEAKCLSCEANAINPSKFNNQQRSVAYAQCLDKKIARAEASRSLHCNNFARSE